MFHEVDFDVLDITQKDIKKEAESISDCDELLPIAQINFVPNNFSETDLDNHKYKFNCAVVSLPNLELKDARNGDPSRSNAYKSQYMGDNFDTVLKKETDPIIDKNSPTRDNKGRFIRTKGEIPCNKCDRTFDRVVSFREHRKVHLHKTTFECEECGKVFVEKIKLVFHLQVDHIKYPCRMCSLKFDNRKCLMSHLMQAHYKKTTHNCTKCCKTFHTKDRLQYHIKSVHSKVKRAKFWQQGEKDLNSSPVPKHDESHSHSIENKSFTQEMVKNEIVSNLQEASPKLPTLVSYNEGIKDEYKASVVSVDTLLISKDEYKASVVSVDTLIISKATVNYRDEKGRFVPSQSRYMCDKCEQSFSTMNEHKKHLRTHLVHKCSFCHETFTGISVLKLHKKENHADLKFTCDDCDKVFKLKSHLKSHIQHVHLNPSKIYTCKVCKKTFSFLAYLKTHESIHKILKPFKCNVCKKAFTQQGTLKAHKLRHTGSKPYKCNVCEKEFSHINYLKAHEIIHDKKKPFQCDKCGKAFTQIGTLKYHKIIHSGAKPFQCDVCGRSFAHPNYLKTHMKVHR